VDEKFTVVRGKTLTEETDIGKQKKYLQKREVKESKTRRKEIRRSSGWRYPTKKNLSSWVQDQASSHNQYCSKNEDV